MTKSELSRLMKYGKSQTVFLKALRTKPSTLARPMVSFSNTNDGLFIVSVDDRQGKFMERRQLSRGGKTGNWGQLFFTENQYCNVLLNAIL